MSSTKIVLVCGPFSDSVLLGHAAATTLERSADRRLPQSGHSGLVVS